MDRFECPCGRVYRIIEEGEGETRKGFKRLFGHAGGEFKMSKPWQAYAACTPPSPQRPISHFLPDARISVTPRQRFCGRESSRSVGF